MAPAKKPPRRELRFVPAMKRLYLFEDGRAIKAVDAWGGPDRVVKDVVMDAGPTDAGDFVIDSVAPYATRTWTWSKIKWGVPLKVSGSDVFFERSPGKWKKTTAVDRVLTHEAIVARHLQVWGAARVPDRWVFNDFGPLAIRYFRDKDKDGKRDPDEPLSGEMFHTTPENEAESAQGKRLKMTESHGCIHLKPLDRDDLMKAGAFTRGTPLKVYDYRVRVTFFLPGEAPPL
jgi:hypothetical protein